MRTRLEDSTFELNLAPMLDIIVSIIPMLLLSVVFVRITVVETPVPQIVEQAVAAANEKNKDTIQVRMSLAKDHSVLITVVDHGQSKEFAVEPGRDAKDTSKLTLNSEGLHAKILAIKKDYPDVFRLELNPSEAIPLEEIVAVMDSVRTTHSTEPKVTFQDSLSGRPIETNLLFPDVVFGNVAGG